MMEKFHHTLPDGHELVLPRFENVPVGVIRKARRLDQADQVFTILEEIMSPADLEHVDKLDRSEFNVVVRAWREGSSIEPGESSASSTS
ncbi:hypothetical protein [Microbacterium sp. MYb62]|uniref:hypothetical protein n=1 Tax=Microbacterium sp. MYb62 TaxID=1848690 RepID=UPI000CFCA437|nr:hypothetical protein [Microbacterium sp. MYb62]PRB14464.1 hypothetical protein CQ042_11125 [Microbacterium sp. MYb62]